MASIAEALNLAIANHQAGRLQEAEGIYRQILAHDPHQAEALHLLGVVAHQCGRPDEALALIAAAILENNTVAAYHGNLGEVYRVLRKFPEAIACLRRALELQPDYPEAYNNLGNVFGYEGQYAEAAACCEQALRLRPDFAQAHNNLGNAIQNQGRLTEAIACFRRALQINPHYAEAHNNLANTLKDQGLIPEAIAEYQTAVALDPENVQAHSNLALTLYCSADHDAESILQEHLRWDERHAQPLARFIEPHTNDRRPDRKLRIGYVSPGFSFNPVGRFMLPLLEAHDQQAFEIFCYSLVRRPDPITQRSRAEADVWRDMVDVPDETLAQTIRADRIDILVDLSMHGADNRLLVFARKPAPVQVTYLAYCGTTGMKAMDYRFTDPFLDQRGRDERYYAEESCWLPETHLCFRPPLATPEVNSLPALRTKHVTFGCFNNFAKVTAATLEAWSKIMRLAADARLVVHAQPASHVQVRDFFGKRAVAPERVTFVPEVPLSDYYANHHMIDIALDPFPYGGGTTTCDALWMGVPVVSLQGGTGVSRMGLSILSNLGLAALVADDVEDYIARAARLAGDLPRLRELRLTMRGRMQASPLMDEPRFARNVEAAYREMWRRWCHEQRS